MDIQPSQYNNPVTLPYVMKKPSEIVFTEPYVSNHVIYYPVGSVLSKLFRDAIKIEHRGVGIYDVKLSIQGVEILNCTTSLFKQNEVTIHLEVECNVNGVEALVVMQIERYNL